MRRILLLSLLAAAAAMVACDDDSTATAPPGSSDPELRTLVDLTTGLDAAAGATGTFNFVGQSFVVPGSGTFTNVRFHWYSFQRVPIAFGNLYLLDREYPGLAHALAPTTTGYVARSDRIENGVYIFAADVRLTGGRKYWVYTDDQGSIAGSFDRDIYSGGDMYVSGVSSMPFRRAQAATGTGVSLDANFRLQAVQQ